MDGELEQIGDMNGTDLQALNNQFVSLTPIWFDLTHSDAIPHVKGWNLKWP
jgi:broad specificity polyphosphatase/5'/3'-nucleotidase SurE